jgi:hypothetical protein
VVERWARLGACIGVKTVRVWCTSAALMKHLGLSGASPYHFFCVLCDLLRLFLLTLLS